ncbi:putative metal ion transporter [Lachnellula subtilissima]|uniref:Putative metal ion transporter n=1 Tax=Lachnellula subtilissima TaxID=602034 RepID=A0A8H8REF7_9HELO|nr:putative metal ion transporter [Lachnellula subtilissima]
MSAQPPSRLTPLSPPQRPEPTAIQSGEAAASNATRNHRGGKKKRTRRQSFAASAEDSNGTGSRSAARDSFYRVQGRNMSGTSIESEALLDHRPQYQNPFRSNENVNRRPRTAPSETDEEGDVVDERAPLISSSRSKSSGAMLDYESTRRRAGSKSSSTKSRKKIFDRPTTAYRQNDEEYNVNYPPSIPGSPNLGASAGNRDMSFGDMMVRDDFAPNRAAPGIIDEEAVEGSVPGSPRRESGYEGRRHTIALQAEEDVCFPIEGMSELAEDDMPQHEGAPFRRANGPRRRRDKWPDLAMLDEWSRFEKEGRSEERRAKKITEPQLIGGRLRPIHKGWHRAEDDAPYRFTYFNEEFQSTIHSQTISELVQPGASFRELFVPDRPELSDSESESEEDDEGHQFREASYLRHANGTNGDSRAPTRQGLLIDPARSDSRAGGGSTSATESKNPSGEATPNGGIKSPPPKSPGHTEKPKRYGDRPTWWLDVLSPTDAEMKVLSKTFGIHPLTAEDIMMQEAREKVELFRNYYFVNYRSFEQDMNNEDFLEPVNMYVVVFREGVISFHFSLTPHPANVRRRIRQLKDYLILSSDWISYAIIDDITDVFAPLIQSIEDEVDDIDDAILKLHTPNPTENDKFNEKRSESGDGTSGESGGDMLRRVGDCRKKSWDCIAC